jgi:hypothetical protein
MTSPVGFVRGVAHPEAYHGLGKKSDYFEGWYIKLVSADMESRWAVIPGIFRGPRSERGAGDHAFVQVLDGITGRAWFHTYPVEEFVASDRGFDVWVGPNHFTPESVTLDLPQLVGRIDITSPLDPWPVTLRSPGIMGWYGMVPLMECFHGIVSFGHSLGGTLRVEGKPVDFTGGRGYIEKDWGTAFPAGYVWLNSNHIDADPSACLIASVALIPWMRSSFRGFIVGMRREGELLTWTTYNGSRERELHIDDSHIRWSLEGPHGVLELTAERKRGGLLKAPLRTGMIERVDETLDAEVKIRHIDTAGVETLVGVGRCAGMEVFGDIERLLETKGRR